MITRKQRVNNVVEESFYFQIRAKATNFLIKFRLFKQILAGIGIGVGV